MPGRFARACAISLLAAARWPCAAAPAPLLVVLDAGDTKQWQAWCAERGWQFLAPWSATTERSIDLRVKTLEARLAEARRKPEIDGSSVYLAGRGEAAAAVFYVASRVPDWWAAALALGGSAQPAIDSFRLFAANTSLLPVLWISPGGPDESAAAALLKKAGYNLEWRAATAANAGEIFDWMAAHRREPFPETVDCETGTPAFAHCYWIEMTKFDAAERNDALASTRVHGGSGAALDLGGFGFDRTAPGPGVTVSWLPEKYSGPLKLKDRIVSLGGKPIANAREFAKMLDETTEERAVVVMIERGNQHIRQETRIVVPKKEETVTARVQGHYIAEPKEIDILSRTVTQMRVTVPEQWAGALLNWNGTPLAKAEAPGCWLLEYVKEIPGARRCP